MYQDRLPQSQYHLAFYNFCLSFVACFVLVWNQKSIQYPQSRGFVVKKYFTAICCPPFRVIGNYDLLSLNWTVGCQTLVEDRRRPLFCHLHWNLEIQYSTYIDSLSKNYTIFNNTANKVLSFIFCTFSKLKSVWFICEADL